jgi:hypothetical protein
MVEKSIRKEEALQCLSSTVGYTCLRIDLLTFKNSENLLNESRN